MHRRRCYRRGPRERALARFLHGDARARSRGSMLVADHPLPGVRGSEQHAHVPSQQPRSEQPARAAAHEQEIEAELVGHLVGQAPTGFVTGMLTALAVLLVLRNAAPRGILLLWLIMLGLLSLP